MEINLGFAILLTLLAGLSTGIGSTIAFFIRHPKYSYLSFLLGISAGVMVYISFTELLGTAIAGVGFLKANLAFFGGIAVFAVIDILVPHSYEEETASDPRLGSSEETTSNTVPGKSTAALKRGGLFIALGIAIHNFPEGMITFASAAGGDVSLGIMIAVAVAIHNIPEGIAVSVRYCTLPAAAAAPLPILFSRVCRTVRRYTGLCCIETFSHPGYTFNHYGGSGRHYGLYPIR
jgi:ZIP family zinc transporter